MRHSRLLVLASVAFALTAPSAIAGDVHSSDGVGPNEACGTPPGNGPATCFTGTTAIQDAATAAGGGGTVNVGKGTFGPVTLTDGITLLGSGHDTIITGPIADPNTALIYAFASAPGFAHPLRISSINLAGNPAPGTRGSEIVLRDQNQNSLDTITNTWFTVAPGSQGSVRGLYSYNSYAPLVLTRNTFSKIQNGVLLETGSGSGGITFGASSITYNLFDHLMRAPAPSGFQGSIQLSVDGTGPAQAGAQDYSRNNFVFEDNQNTVGLEYNGHNPSNSGIPATVGFHSNNLDDADVGVVNETTNGTVSATDTWWGCSQGPDVNPAPGTGNKNCADALQAPGMIDYRPWLTGKAPISVGASG